jgi:hypothetical protein
VTPQVTAAPEVKRLPTWSILTIAVVLFGLTVFINAILFKGINLSPDQTKGAAALAEGTDLSPTGTPRPELGMDLSQFVDKYDGMTDAQKKDFISQSTGLWVSWSGEISDVKSDGTILVNIPGTLTSFVQLEGIPPEDALKRAKGETIRFTGQINNILDTVGLHIYLKDVQQFGQEAPLNVETGTVVTGSTLIPETTTVPGSTIIPESTTAVEPTTAAGSTTVPEATTVPDLTQTNGIGDTVQMGDLTLVVSDFEFSDSNGQSVPDSGNQFAIVDVTIDNQGSKTLDLPSLTLMTLKDDTGQVYSVDTSTLNISGGISTNGKLAAGQEFSGQLVFQVPVDAQGFQFLFDARSFGGGKVSVDLGI